MKKVRASDKAEVAEDLRKIYRSIDIKSAQEEYLIFLEKWGSKYPKVKKTLELQENLFTLLEFPRDIQRSLYTYNIVENFNKRVKKRTKVKDQFPNQSSLDHLICTIVLEYNQKFSNRMHKGFGKVRYELLEMFKK